MECDMLGLVTRSHEKPNFAYMRSVRVRVDASELVGLAS